MNNKKKNFFNFLQLKVPSNDGHPELPERGAERCADDLEKQCETLQQRLDQVQKEILKILSEKRACSEENCALKLQISELMTRLPGAPEVERAIRGETAGAPADGLAWSSSPVSGGRSAARRPFEAGVLCDADALRFVENESRLAEPPTPEKAEEARSAAAVDASSLLTAVSEEESEMEWKTIGDERKAAGESMAAAADTCEAAGDEKSAPKYEMLLQDYQRLSKENRTLSEKCEELGSCLEALRSEYDQCEEYWASKLDEERRLFEEVTHGGWSVGRWSGAVVGRN